MSFQAPSPTDQRDVAAPPNTVDLQTICSQIVGGTVVQNTAIEATAPSTQENPGPDNAVA